MGLVRACDKCNAIIEVGESYWLCGNKYLEDIKVGMGSGFKKVQRGGWLSICEGCMGINVQKEAKNG